jgi:hypothetical protein
MTSSFSRPARQQSELEKRQHDKSRCSGKGLLMRNDNNRKTTPEVEQNQKENDKATMFNPVILRTAQRE